MDALVAYLNVDNLTRSYGSVLLWFCYCEQRAGLAIMLGLTTCRPYRLSKLLVA